MQQEYKIEWMERKTTSTGKKKIDCTIKSISGVEHQNVTIWEGFPDFDNLMVGSNVTGEYAEKQNGQYLNKTLYPVRTTAPRSAPSGIKVAQERKADMIKEAQDNKNESIKESAAQRDAVIITTTFFADLINIDENVRDRAIKEKVESWRNYFLTVGDKPPFQ
jgi:hypothetical protein